jgi:hypothetical protein
MGAVAWRVPTALAEELGPRLAGRLLLLTRAVARMGITDGVFDMGARRAAREWKIKHFQTAARTLRELEAAGALVCLARGKYEPSHAHQSRWAFTDRLARPVDKPRSEPVRQSQKGDCDSLKIETQLSTSYLGPTELPRAPVYMSGPPAAHHQPCDCPWCLKRIRAMSCSALPAG